jgi:hypothetical protein
MALTEHCFDERQSLVTADVNHISELFSEEITERGSANFFGVG